MSRRFIGQRVGLLDDSNPDVGAGADDNTARLPEEPAADSLETELLEVSDSAGEVADKEEQVEEAVDVAEGLEEYRSQMRASLQNGGMSRDAALAIQTAAARELARIGGSGTTLPAMEHFGGASARMEATKLGIEAISDKIKEIWKKIVEMLNKAYEWVRGHMLKVFGAGEKLVKRAQALKKAAGDNTVGAAKEKKIKRGALVKELNDGKGTGADCAKLETLSNLTEISKTISEEWPQVCGKFGESAADAFEAIADGKEMKDHPGFDSVIFSEAAPTKTGHEAPEGTEAKATKMLPGGIVGLAFKAGKQADIKAFARQKVLLTPADKDFGKNVSNEELNVLAKGDITKIAELVENLGNYLATYRKADNKFKPVEERVKKAAKRIGDLVGKEKEGAGGPSDDDLRAIQQLAQVTPELMTGFPAKFYTLAINKAKGFLDYAELSLAQYKA